MKKERTKHKIKNQMKIIKSSKGISYLQDMKEKKTNRIKLIYQQQQKEKEKNKSAILVSIVKINDKFNIYCVNNTS